MAGGAQVAADLPDDSWALMGVLTAWQVDMQEAADMRSEVMHSVDMVDLVSGG